MILTTSFLQLQSEYPTYSLQSYSWTPEAGVWYDIELGVNIASGSDGYYELYLNGDLVLSRTGIDTSTAGQIDTVRVGVTDAYSSVVLMFYTDSCVIADSYVGFSNFPSSLLSGLGASDFYIVNHLSTIYGVFDNSTILDSDAIASTIINRVYGNMTGGTAETHKTVTYSHNSFSLSTNGIPSSYTTINATGASFTSTTGIYQHNIVNKIGVTIIGGNWTGYGNGLDVGVRSWNSFNITVQNVEGMQNFALGCILLNGDSGSNGGYHQILNNVISQNLDYTAVTLNEQNSSLIQGNIIDGNDEAALICFFSYTSTCSNSTIEK
jgi:hypothetical protein